MRVYISKRSGWSFVANGRGLLLRGRGLVMVVEWRTERVHLRLKKSDVCLSGRGRGSVW